MPHMPWGTSAGTCSTDLGGTSSGHPGCLIARQCQVHVMQFSACPYLRRQTSRDIGWHGLGSHRCCSAGDATSRVAEGPWRDWESGPRRAGMQP